ncbi:hypothetical protein GGH13_003608 [Coemansia sp. S155-1]|nr:hypothetical protein GGH13_003608 [Coemansia sp. S155-1]
MIIQEYFYFATSVLQRSTLPATDAVIIAMSLYVVLRNKTPLSKWFGNMPSLLACAALAALAVHSSAAWTGLLYSTAALLSVALSASTTGYTWFQAFHLIGIYQALNGSSEVWSSAVCALLHGVLVLANLDASSKSLLHQVFQQCTYAQERYLHKLQKLRQVMPNDLWPLPERFQLRTAYSEFKLNTNESYFVIRAIFRMMWRPMIPVYIVGLLLQLIPLIKLKLDSSIMHNVDDLSNYSMYMIIADIARIMIFQLLNNQQRIARQYIENEIVRAQNAIDIERFRMPLQRLTRYSQG